MAKTILFPMLLNLQLFAEGAGGGDGGTGAEGATGVSAPAAEVQTTGDNTPAAEVKDRNAEFEALIKGEYKDLYDARVSDTVQKRLKSSKETVEKYEALTPTLEALAKKYGVDPADIKALNKAIEEDDSYYEEEALEKGITVEQLKEIRKLERENAEFKKMQAEQENQAKASQMVAAWQAQAEQTKSVYPGFDMNTEMQNPQFVNLLKSNIDVRTAFEVLHKDEIIPAAMQYTAQQTKSKISKAIASGSNRPVENGISSQSAARVKSDVSQLSKADRDEIYRRAQRGEKITFG